MKKFTPWFKASKHNPTRVGVYEVRFGKEKYTCYYSRWGGLWWGNVSASKISASTELDKSAWMCGARAEWRGLLK